MNYIVVALYMFGYCICLLPGDYTMYLNMIKDWELGPALITSAKFVLAYPFVYHAVNGVRHLVGAVSSTRRCPSPSPHCLKPH